MNKICGNYFPVLNQTCFWGKRNTLLLLYVECRHIQTCKEPTKHCYPKNPLPGAHSSCCTTPGYCQLAVSISTKRFLATAELMLTSVCWWVWLNAAAPVPWKASSDSEQFLPGDAGFFWICCFSSLICLFSAVRSWSQIVCHKFVKP